MNKSIRSLCAVISIFCTASMLFADNIASKPHFGRYTTEKAKLAPYQTNLLNQKFSIHFQENIKSIDDAIILLLKFSGFHLSKQQSKLTRVMLSNSLPDAFRNISNSTLSQALIGITGGIFDIVVDPVYRSIEFIPKDEIRNLYRSDSNKEFMIKTINKPDGEINNGKV